MHPESVISPRGRRGIIQVRDGTSDLSVVLSTFSNDWAGGDDEYRLADLHLEGTFVDVGAHIGTVALAVLLDNPDVSAILVEPIPDNLDMAKATMHANGFEATFVSAAVGATQVQLGDEDVDDRFVGNLGSHTGPIVPTERVTLPQLVKMAGGRIAALKTDCEGGEWSFLRSRAVAKCDRIFGEYHGDPGPDGLRERLGRTHDLVIEPEGATGRFWAVAR